MPLFGGADDEPLRRILMACITELTDGKEKMFLKLKTYLNPVVLSVIGSSYLADG